MNIWSNQVKRDWDDRVAALKSKLKFDDVVAGLGLVDAPRNGLRTPAPDCPYSVCGAKASIHQCHAGHGFHCDVCNGSGDIVDLVRVVTGCGFRDAVRRLEEIVVDARDDQTRELFE